jgi:hypothetical protein
MKNTIKLFLMALFLFAFNSSYSQVTFGVAPGFSLNSAQLGYQVNPNIIPFIGIQYANVGFTFKDTYTSWDYDIDAAVTTTDEGKFTGSVIIPTVGVKYFIANQNKLKSYVTACVSKPLVSAKAEYNGEEDEDVKEVVDNLSLFGSEVGFGVEFFFDPSFSIGGEFGLRMFSAKSELTYDSEYYNPNTGMYVPYTEVVETKGSLNPTYTKVSLNFYFNKDKK